MTEQALPITILQASGVNPALLDHTLALRFDLKQLDSRITFSRASTAVYYDASTTAKAEENLWTYAANTIPNQNACAFSANAGTAPDGVATASLITPSNASGNHTGGYVSLAETLGLDYVFSFYAKANGYSLIRFGDAASGRVYATFDLTALTVSGTGGSIYVDSGIEDVGNGWRRCWVKWNFPTGTLMTPAVTPFPSGATPDVYGRASFTGDGTSGAYFWGFQVEQRSKVSSFIPTVASNTPITKYIPVLQTAAANAARFDHNPLTRECLGLFIEEQRTNLLTYSSDLSNAAWPKTNLAVNKEAAIAPNGTQTANKLIPTSTNALHYYYRAVSVPNNTYTYSAYVKAGEISKFNFYFNDSAGSSCNTVITVGATALTFSGPSLSGTVFSAPSFSYSYLGNGWFRVALTVTITGATTTSVALLMNDVGGTTTSFAGNGYSGLYFWGAQLEVGACVTSYIPTVAAQVTRSADSAIMTGTNFSSWFNAAEGTLVMEGVLGNGASTVKGYAALTDGTTAQRILAYISTQFPYVLIATSGVAQFSDYKPSVAVGSYPKIAVGYAANNCLFSANGSIGTVDTSVTLPTVNRLEIGSYAGGAGNINSTIKRILYFPKRLSDSNMQAITT